MVYDLQKGSVWKRIAAWIFDTILVLVLAVGFGFLLSTAMGYEGYSDTLYAGYEKYETQYGVTFNISQEEYLQESQQYRDNYDAAYEALLADGEVIYAYNMVLQMSLTITAIGILLSVLSLEFAVPLLLKNGQTVGKKIFGLGVISSNGVRMNTMQLFVRALLGKYTVETMIPVFIVLMVFFGIMDLTGTLVLFGLLILQAVLLIATRTNSLIHDLLPGTVVVDLASQMIFPDAQARIDYQKRLAAEKALKQNY